MSGCHTTATGVSGDDAIAHGELPKVCSSVFDA
jgi:hypothetical protein